jgi:exodeoxyribonuclease-3
MDLVKRFVKAYNPDILCLQETKCPDDRFPVKAFRRLGYEHIALNGQKGYHGVATLSRLPFADVSRRGFCEKRDARHLSVKVADDIVVHNFYVPSGGDIPDTEQNPKFAHKLAFLREMSEWFGNHKGKRDNKMVLVGDLNVAPLECDVWSHKQLLKVVSHTPVEVEHLNEVLASHAWIDVTRRNVPAPERLYTWWSYRSPDWTRNDRGRRLDHIWVTPKLNDQAREIAIAREARSWPRPSDHVPVILSVAARPPTERGDSRRAR